MSPASRMDPLAQQVMEWVGGDCPCRSCLTARWDERRPGDISSSYPSFMGIPAMIVCATCGNKRCPHAEHHDNACTGSNEPGQPGSSY